MRIRRFQMTVFWLGIVVGALCSFAQPSAQDQARAANEHARALRAGLQPVEADPESDDGPATISMADDGAGVLVEISRKPTTWAPEVGRTVEQASFFWAVDRLRHKSWVFYVDGRPADIERIQAFRNRHGLRPVSAQRITEQIKAAADRQARLNAAAVSAEQPTLVQGMIAGPYVEAEPAREIVVSCIGSGVATRITEDPISIKTTETTAGVAWSRTAAPNQQITGLTPDPAYCWAKSPGSYPFPANTQWYTDSCAYTNTPSPGSFDLSLVATYHNDDFMGGIFGRTSVWAQAAVAVAATYGPTWATYSFTEGTVNYMITGYGNGSVAEGCSQSDTCGVSEEELRACRNGSDFGEWNYETCECDGGPSPVIIRMTDDPIRLTSANDGVRFDLMANNHPIQTAWTARGSEDAFLVLDRNGNGRIDSGAELFGNFTEQPAGSNKNGFLALAVFDERNNGGDSDGRITARDQIYSALRVWVDANHDGLSQPTELRTLMAAGVTEISLSYHLSRQRDQFGNVFRYKGRALVDPDGRSHRPPMPREAVDVFFAYRR